MTFLLENCESAWLAILYVFERAVKHLEIASAGFQLRLRRLQMQQPACLSMQHAKLSSCFCE